MKETTRTTEEFKKSATEAARSGIGNYEQAFQTGRKLQEEALHCWGSMLSQPPSFTDWQKSFTPLVALSGKWMPMAEEQIQQAMGLMEQNTRIGAELMQKAVQAAQTPTIADSQAKWTDFWVSSMKAAESNVESLIEISTQAISAWTDMLQKSVEASRAQVPKMT